VRKDGGSGDGEGVGVNGLVDVLLDAMLRYLVDHVDDITLPT